MTTRSRHPIQIEDTHYVVATGGLEKTVYYRECRHCVLIPKTAIVRVSYLEHARITIHLHNGSHEHISLPRFDNDTYDTTQAAELHALYARIRSMVFA
jgi:hypothetical protein